MKVAIIASVVLWTLLAWGLAGCSVKVEVGYHGLTGKDDRTYTRGK